MGLIANPLEPLTNSMALLLVDFWFFGLDPLSVGITSYIIVFINNFIHANIKTPYWLGYIIQRPEMHKIHHTYQHHRDNYAIMPCIDLIFGTFNNQSFPTRKFGFKQPIATAEPCLETTLPAASALPQ